ncbi:MAG: class I SAM-dependent methyltransferase [Pirellulales bacterium]|nr:class I SAM-dependent methyltransferase [Pirellulales bacterium]
MPINNQQDISHNINGKESRFAFGKNWEKYLRVVNSERIDAARASLVSMLGVEDLRGRRFLDIGCGSGLFSLAARILGASVYSFDYDDHSVATTAALKHQYYPDDNQWIISQGSVLDAEFMSSLGEYDVVYSWGVLHHTGAMWQAFNNLPPLLAPGGKLYISIYNDQHWISSYWKVVKRLYNQYPSLKVVIISGHLWRFFGRIMIGALRRQSRPRRGMSFWYDYLDWLGGYPFEVAMPECIFDFYQQQGFVLSKLTTCGGKSGCNEFVFEKTMLYVA